MGIAGVRARRARGLHAAVVLAGAAVLLSGCSTSTTTPSAAPTVTVTAGPSATATPAPTTTTTVTATPSAAPPATAPATAAAAARCATAQLTGAWHGIGAAAGTSYGELVLTNTGSSTCTLQGWPGVSLVGGGDGTQLGAAAAQDRTGQDPHPTVPLAPGGAAEARVGVGTALDYPTSRCRPSAADGFRVYPPGERASLFVRQREEACRSASVVLLHVQAVVPAP